MGRVGTFGLVLLVATGCGRFGFEAGVDHEAGVVGDSATPVSCMPGAILVGQAATNVSLSAAADACNVEAALVLDGTVGGLDRSASCSTLWSPVQGSCGCISIDLGAIFPVAGIHVWAAPTGDACGPSPCGLCGTGHTFDVLVGTVPGDNHKVGFVDMTVPTLTEYQITFAETARYVVLCRQSWGEERDDVQIDYVTATCR